MKTSLLIIVLSFSWQLFAAEIETQESIFKQSRNYIKSHLVDMDDYEIELLGFDSRLKLPKCSQPLQIQSQNRTLKAGRNTLSVKCKQQAKWSVYVSAMIRIYKDVIVAARPVRRGEIIRADSLKLQRRDIASLRTAYGEDLTAFINLQSSRNISADSVVNPGYLKPQTLIKKGDKVTIAAHSRNFDIQMAGIALMNGSKGQNIKVKNIKSKQIVHATVIKPNQVSVLY